jgi:hypothetical protein
LKTKAGIIQADLHNAAQDIQGGYDAKGLRFTVSPIKFSDRVIEIIENDFATFEGHSSAAHPLPSVAEHTGESGWRKK